MDHGARKLFSRVAILSLALLLFGALVSPAQAKDTRKPGDTDPESFTVASLNGFYTYANLAEVKAGYGLLKLDGRGNVSTDDITLNRPLGPDANSREITHLGPGTGTYTVSPSGVGQLQITFVTQEPEISFSYEFVIKRAIRNGKNRAPLATEIFTASDTTGVANASVTYISPLKKGTQAPVAKFNVASIEGRYAYTNNADFFASYGVLVFDGSGNVYCDGKLNQNAPIEGTRVLRRYGPCSGTYIVDSNGRGSFTLAFFDLGGAEYTYDFVLTRTAGSSRRGSTLATELFSAITVAGLSGQLVAPTLTRIFPP